MQRYVPVVTLRNWRKWYHADSTNAHDRTREKAVSDFSEHRIQNSEGHQSQVLSNDVWKGIVRTYLISCKKCKCNKLYVPACSNFVPLLSPPQNHLSHNRILSRLVQGDMWQPRMLRLLIYANRNGDYQWILRIMFLRIPR